MQRHSHMAKPLADAWAKFNRAKVHAHSLRRKILGWLKSQGTRPIFWVQLDEDEAAGCLILKVRRVKRLPPTWSLLAGDAVFNFRASLDYLAWQLVQAGTQANTGKPEAVMWPIILRQVDAEAAIGGRLPGILPKHRTFVEACHHIRGSRTG